MTKFWHGAAQIGLVVLQVANAAAPFVPPPYNIVVSGSLGVVQAIIAIYHHQKPPVIMVSK